GLDFIDCDQELERRAGASIAWIFDVEGEAGFRARESRLLDELTNRNGVLLATGGGAVTRSQNRSYLIERGLVVYLDASLDLLVERTAKDKKRPLLQVADPRQALADLKKERDPLYRQIADTRVRVQNHGGKQAVAQILAALADDGYVTD
ncbi:MAG: shikimate kinase, partial [Pseudomonadales bacterium]